MREINVHFRRSMGFPVRNAANILPKRCSLVSFSPRLDSRLTSPISLIKANLGLSKARSGLAGLFAWRTVRAAASGYQEGYVFRPGISRIGLAMKPSGLAVRPS